MRPASHSEELPVPHPSVHLVVEDESKAVMEVECEEQDYPTFGTGKHRIKLNHPALIILLLFKLFLLLNFINPLTPSGPQNLTTFVYGGFVDIWIREMDSSAFSLFLLTVDGRKVTGA
ncbi:hypothetical protein AVEN_134766-1 [Araneus ventricosus]|uniref:Uncharacterized protein n=1 Tax=Araneus ventricosus TaxID=182803 RepID=A0A4Y2G8N2_ARAVE|nr:hypothetical protein AVEN_134766-1 [Araneus ventricosus]